MGSCGPFGAGLKTVFGLLIWKMALAAEKGACPPRLEIVVSTAALVPFESASSGGRPCWFPDESWLVYELGPDYRLLFLEQRNLIEETEDAQ